jgi:hypothetical protein
MTSASLLLADAAGLLEFAAQRPLVDRPQLARRGAARVRAALALALAAARAIDQATFGAQVCDVLAPLYERGRKARLAAEVQAEAKAWRTRLALEDDMPAATRPATEESR